MADGSTKPIEKVAIGDEVISFNEKTGQFETNKVTELFIHETDLLFVISYEDGTKLETTWNHPFWIRDLGWVEAKDLKPGDLSLLQGDHYLQITDISQKHLEKQVHVYNFEVENVHSYLVGNDGVVVHNYTLDVAGEVAFIKDSKDLRKVNAELSKMTPGDRDKFLSMTFGNDAAGQAARAAYEQDLQKQASEDAAAARAEKSGTGGKILDTTVGFLSGFGTTVFGPVMDSIGMGQPGKGLPSDRTRQNIKTAYDPAHPDAYNTGELAGETVGAGVWGWMLGESPAATAEEQYQTGRTTPETKAGDNGAKEILIDRSKYPESAKHIDEAQQSGQPSVLTIDRSGAAQRRADALRGTQPQTGLDRDEYPPAMFQEGGNGSDVKYINPSDNRGSGKCIGVQCKDLPDGTKVKIKTTGG